MRSDAIVRTGLAALALYAVLPAIGCKSAAEREFDRRMEIVESLTKKRLARERELADMSITGLVRELRRDSQRGVEPFNSMPYAVLVSRGDKSSDDLKALLSDAEQTSHLGLLALRQVNADAYGGIDPQLRVNVLTNSLANAQYFNAWGLPHLRWEGAAKAIIAEGAVAQAALKALYQDRRPAPVWGSEGVLEFRKYRFRVCDYAWALSKAIEGDTIEIPTDPTKRDELIKADS